MLLNVENLDKTIRERRLLKDVSFTIMEGEASVEVGNRIIENVCK